MKAASFPVPEMFAPERFEAFLGKFIEQARGSSLILVKFQSLKGLNFPTLLKHLLEWMDGHHEVLNLPPETGFYVASRGEDNYLGLRLPPQSTLEGTSALRGALADIHGTLALQRGFAFHFGIGRTQSNWVSDAHEIFADLETSAQNSLDDNARKVNWASFNRLNNYFGGSQIDAVIQPLVEYSSRRKAFSVVGGEVFVGGTVYRSYHELMRDLPQDQDLMRLDLLILEKLLASSKGAPGLLKFNIMPQTLIDTFDQPNKVDRFVRLVMDMGLKVENVRLELVEKPYVETRQSLLTVCRMFSDRGITLAADDFGMRSQGHQLVLELGELIKEFKLDPISFQYKVEDDHTKFLDNLAFLQYCKHLANNREAMITAEALEDVENLDFLLGHQIYHFQANMFCGKLSFPEYIDLYPQMQNLAAETVFRILRTPPLRDQLQDSPNIFTLAGTQR